MEDKMIRIGKTLFLMWIASILVMLGMTATKVVWDLMLWAFRAIGA